MSPWLAISRKQIRESLNLRRNPRDLPVNWHLLRRRMEEEFFGILFRLSTAASLSSMGRVMSRITAFNFARLSHLFFTIRSRFFCLAIEHLFAISYSLFFSARPFLALFAVWVSFVDHIDTSSAADNEVPFRWIGLDGCSYFHESYPCRMRKFIPEGAICIQETTQL